LVPFSARAPSPVVAAERPRRRRRDRLTPPLFPPAAKTQPQPKEVLEIKKFLLLARQKDARSCRIKKNPGGVTKFKVRTARYLHTLKVADQDKAEKLEQSLPPSECFRFLPSFSPSFLSVVGRFSLTLPPPPQ